MPISIVVGGQFGSEGKGKVAHYLAQEKKASIVVRCGGTNSGHTVIDEGGNAQIFQQLPTAAILPEVDLALCAGTYIDIDILKEELNRAKVDDKRLTIDPYAVIITPAHKQSESISGLTGAIGSTGSGTGAAVGARIQRGENVIFAKDVKELEKYISKVNEELRSRLNKKQRVIIEGTQGFGLSPLHSGLNPYVTSRDTTAAGFLSEVGLSPFDVDEVAMVIRAFPIRVGGNSGPLNKELSWDSLSQLSGKHIQEEYTSVTKHLRRIAEFDPHIVRLAISHNKPSHIFLNHIDYLPEHSVEDFVTDCKTNIGANIDFVGDSPKTIRNRSV